MGSSSEARPPASRPAAGPRPALVSVLAGAWFLLAVLGAIGAVLVLSRSAAEQRIFAALSLPLAALFGAGALGLLRRATWARALLATAGLLALVVSAFSSYRNVTAASGPAAELAAAEPDAANALVLFRAGSAVAFLLSSLPLLAALGFLRHPSVRAWLGIPERPRRGPDPLLVVGGAALLVAGGAVLFSKGRSRPAPAKAAAAAPALDPPETFLWSDQPVVFPPPPAPFTRERHAEGGRKGVSFTRYAVPPTRITVAEAALEPAPNTPEEAIARLRLTKETFRSADSAEVGEPVPAAVAGAPAFQTDYTIRERSMEHRGREIVALAGRRVFVFTFLGRGADLPLFESLVASVRFPAPGSPGGGATDGTAAPAAAAPAGEETDLRVGEHRVRARIPDGWERVDYGAKQEIRRGETRIALVDGGALPPGTGPANLEDDWLVQRALRLFGHDARRWEVGARSRAVNGDVEALAVETRDPLSHVPHARCWIFVNGGRLLAVGPVLGGLDATRPAVDAVARSVRFPG
jgi:hypothetical protein